ncbi:MAG TPA: glutathione S-transferase family protein [Polyangiaceae bacterium]|jgi:glutathione S-transferase|nr:glutathione S-transferase family protein [Polyangiaceae bacterium]
MITLFDIPLSPYAQKVKMALLEKGVVFEAQIPDLDEPDPDFVALSPRLEVPAYVDGEVRLFDSSVILEYLEDTFRETPLLPEKPAERARVRLIEEMCDTAYDAVNWGVAEVTVFSRATGDVAERLLTMARTQVTALNDRLEHELVGRQWLNGDAFGFGDVVAYPFVNSAASLGNKPVPGSKLEGWLKAVRGRPSAVRLRDDVIATLPRFMNRPKDIADGKARRQYRDHRLDWMLRSGGLDIVVDGIRNGTIRFSIDF